MGGKKSSCILLLAAFAAFLRLGSTEGDPLPPSLVDLVRESPLSSIDDLKKLLDTESVDEESDNQTTNDLQPSDGHHSRVPRSLITSNAEAARPAACKVRTEVLEVTRSMHDRTNAHFMLWPLCVEVQRCSGCCTSRTSQCVPVVTEIRQLQMSKITYVNTRPHFEKVIVPVEDHVRCDCQPLTSPYSSSSSSNNARRPQPHPQPVTHPPQPPAPRVAHKPAQPHAGGAAGHHPSSQTKEDLHRHDVLKHNQRLQMEGQDAQGGGGTGSSSSRLWQNSKYSPSHTATEPHHTPVRLDYQASRQPPPQPPRPNTPVYPQANTPQHTPSYHHQQQQQQRRQQEQDPYSSSSLTQEEASVASEAGVRVGFGGEGEGDGEGQQGVPAAPHYNRDRDNSGRQQEAVRQPQPTFQHASSSSGGGGGGDDYSRQQGGVQQQQQQDRHQQQPYQHHDYKLTVENQHGRQTQTQSSTHMLRDSTHQTPTQHHRHGQPADTGSTFHHKSQSDMASSGGHGHSVQSEGSSQYEGQAEVTSSPRGRGRHETEEERRRTQLVEELEREKEKEIQEEVVSQQQQQQQHQQDSYYQHHQTSSQRAVTESLSTLRPENTSPRPQTTPRPQVPRRRRRKNRRRISKTTMRAMIMVMS